MGAIIALYSVLLPGGMATSGLSGMATSGGSRGRSAPAAPSTASHFEIALCAAHSFMPVPLTLAWMSPM
jgi:hypothetical protein